MPIINEFKTCDHQQEGQPPIRDWRECYSCIGEVTTQLIIARSYLTELAKGRFNDNGVCVQPVGEPVQGRDFQQIARTGLSAAS